MQKKVWLAFVSILTVITLFTLHNARSSSIPVVVMTPLQQSIQKMEQTGKMEIPDIGDGPDEKKKWALLRDVITCESESHWKINPVPKYGYDVGPCQINTYWHSVKAAGKGYDLYVPSHNVLYCIELFEQYYPAMVSGGWNPWRATQSCWEERQMIRTAQNRL